MNFGQSGLNLCSNLRAFKVKKIVRNIAGTVDQCFLFHRFFSNLLISQMFLISSYF